MTLQRDRWLRLAPEAQKVQHLGVLVGDHGMNTVTQQNASHSEAQQHANTGTHYLGGSFKTFKIDSGQAGQACLTLELTLGLAQSSTVDMAWEVTFFFSRLSTHGTVRKAHVALQ